jgi:hypothetical protein
MSALQRFPDPSQKFRQIREGPLADIAPTGMECAERGYLCKMHHFIAVVACEE